MLSMLARKIGFGPLRKDIGRFKETVLVAVVQNARLDDFLEAAEWNFGEVSKSMHISSAYGRRAPIVVIGRGERSVVFTSPTGLRSEVFWDEMNACVEAMQEAVSMLCEASFVVRFGAGDEHRLVEVRSMTGERKPGRGALALRVGEWSGSAPTLLETFKTAGPVWRPDFGLSYRTSGSSVAMHSVSETPEAAAEGMDAANEIVEREYGKTLPAGDHPENTVVLDLADGRAWDMSGGIAVPANFASPLPFTG